SNMLNPASSIDGIDISAEMLAQAAESLSADNRHGRMQQADLARLPFSSRRFDLVMSAHTLEHLPSFNTGLEEMMRVVKPGGLLLIVVTQPGIWGRWIQHRWRIQLLTEEGLINQLEQLGLTEIRSYPLSGSIWSTNGSVALIGRLPAVC
ncbi:MAG: class I SAM-dependent methyltransferase, partial [Chloroflexota bacterium]